MKPNEPGIWEWFDEDGTKRLVEVVNVCSQVEDQWLRVYWWGGYYNVNDEAMGTPDEPFMKAEWPDRWGNRVGNNHSLPNEQLYLQPTREELIRKADI